MITKLKTCKRYNIPGHAHELTFSCYKGLKLFNEKRTCRYLLEALSRAREKHRFHIWAWVIMPEHIHLLIWPTCSVYSISNILQSIKQPVSRRIIAHARKHQARFLDALATGMKGKPYHFWQAGGGYDRNITSTEALLNSVNYIHNNPVRRDLVKMPEDWLWSSARDWMGEGKGPISIDRKSFPMI